MIKFFGITGIILIIASVLLFWGSEYVTHQTLAAIGFGIGFMNLGISVIISILDEIFEKLSENKENKN